MAERKIGERTIRLEVGDITEFEGDAFVFDITEDAKIGSGYGTAIANRAGKVVQDELDEIGTVPTGEAVVTSAGRLKVEYIIHTNGPKFFEADTEGKLRRATEACLQRADEKGMKRIAFPPIGTGMYQVDLGLCASVMVDAIAAHLQGETSLEEVVMVALNSREWQPLEAEIGGA